MKGPVPTGFDETSAPLACALAGENGMPTPPVSSSGNGPYGEASGYFTVSVSTTSMDATGASVPAQRDVGALLASKFDFSAAESRLVPSWNLTFGRSFSVQDRLSDDGVRDSASHGLIEPSSDRTISWS